VAIEAALAEALEALSDLILDALTEITVPAAMRASRGLAAERRNGGKVMAICLVRSQAIGPASVRVVGQFESAPSESRSGWTVTRESAQPVVRAAPARVVASTSLAKHD